MLRAPRNYGPIILVLVFEVVILFVVFARRIGAALSGQGPELPWIALDTGLFVVQLLSLALGIWLWKRAEAD